MTGVSFRYRSSKDRGGLILVKVYLKIYFR